MDSMDRSRGNRPADAASKYITCDATGQWLPSVTFSFDWTRGSPNLAGSSSVNLSVRRLGDKGTALPTFGVQSRGVVE